MYRTSEGRRLSNRANNNEDRQRVECHSGAEIDFIGVMGEAAEAQVLGGYIDSRTRPDHGNDILGLDYTVDVKTPTKPHYNLVFADHSPLDADYAVLVLPTIELDSLFDVNELNVYGYASRSEFENGAERKNLRGNSWFFHKSKLHDMTENLKTPSQFS